MTNKDSVFVTKRVMNQDIYDKLLQIEEHVVKTNGKVMANSTNIKFVWATISTMVMVFVIIFNFMINH